MLTDLLEPRPDTRKRCLSRQLFAHRPSASEQGLDLAKLLAEFGFRRHHIFGAVAAKLRRCCIASHQCASFGSLASARVPSWNCTKVATIGARWRSEKLTSRPT